MSTVNLDHLKAQVELLRWCRARESEIADVKKQARAAIEEALGDNESGSVDGELAVAWRTQKRKSLNQKILKENFPDAYENSLETTEVRRFEIFL
jgi:predicted phage-related endonuclease